MTFDIEDCECCDHYEEINGPKGMYRTCTLSSEVIDYDGDVCPRDFECPNECPQRM